jgi:hypothetical protein
MLYAHPTFLAARRLCRRRSRTGPKVAHGFALSMLTWKRLTAAIRNIPERERLVLNLSYYEDLTLKEICFVLDAPEPRVSQIHASAILYLRSELADSGYRQCLVGCDTLPILACRAASIARSANDATPSDRRTEHSGHTTDPACDQSMKPKLHTSTVAGVGVGHRASGDRESPCRPGHEPSEVCPSRKQPAPRWEDISRSHNAIALV